MTVSKSPRVGLTRWDSDNDPWSREDWDADNAQVEELMAIDLQVAALVDRPAAGQDELGQPADTRGRYCYVEATGLLYRDTGAAWVTIGPGYKPEHVGFSWGPPPSNGDQTVGWHPAGVAMGTVYDDATDLALVPPAWIRDLNTDPLSPHAGSMIVGLPADPLGLYEVTLRMEFVDPTVPGAFPDGSVWALGYAHNINAPADLGPRIVSYVVTAAERNLALIRQLELRILVKGAEFVGPRVYLGAQYQERQFVMHVDVVKYR